MNQQIPEFKYYNLCLPKEILDTAKSIAAKKGLKLKDYFAKIIVEANNKELSKEQHYERCCNFIERISRIE